MKGILTEDQDVIYIDNYAEIEDGQVINIIWLASSNAGEFPNCVRVGENLPVTIGDTYDGYNFYHDGEMVLTNEQSLYKEIADIDNDIADLVEIIYNQDLKEIERV